MGQVLQPLNRIELRGRVGSHTISLNDRTGMWEGWFDLHVATRTMHGIWQPQVFDCHVSEDGKHIKDLGVGIGGKIVNVVGRLVQFPEENAVDCYVQVSRLTVVGDAGDELKVPDPPKTEEELKIKKGVLF